MLVHPNDDKHPIGLMVQYLRRNKALSIADLASKAGITAEAIDRIEDYSRPSVSDHELKALAAAFGVNPEILTNSNPEVKEALGTHMLKWPGNAYCSILLKGGESNA